MDAELILVTATLKGTYHLHPIVRLRSKDFRVTGGQQHLNVSKAVRVQELESRAPWQTKERLRAMEGKTGFA